MAAENNKIITLDGGFAIEIEAALLRGDENITRNHDDLDLHVLEEDILFWQDWFKGQNFHLDTDPKIIDKTKAFLAYSPDKTFYVDVYSVRVDENKQLSSWETGEKDDWEAGWDEVFLPVKWHGFAFFVMRHELILRNKREFAQNLNQPLRDIDLHDKKLFV